MIKTLKNINTSKIFIQLCLDGDLLSNHHKIFPYNDFAVVGRKGEAEECIKGVIKDLKKYIVEIHFDFLSYDLKEKDYFLIKKAITYFNSITYFHFNRKLKTPNPYKLKNGDNIASLLKYILKPTSMNEIVSKYILYGRTTEEDGDKIVYSKGQNRMNLEYLISTYNVDITDMVHRGLPIAVYLLANNKGSTYSEFSEQMLKDLISLGMPYKKEYELQASKLYFDSKKNIDISSSMQQLLRDKDLEKLVSFINQNKSKISNIIKNITLSDLITDEYFNKDIFSFLCKEFPEQLINLDVLENGYSTKYYDTIKHILLKYGILNKVPTESILRFSDQINDFQLSMEILKNKPDVLSDKLFNIVNSLYEKSFSYKEYDLLKLILSLGFYKRLDYDISYNRFIELANNDKKILSLLKN